ncbi:hypothetical protein KI387_001880, partial [Taxus chinensis]
IYNRLILAIVPPLLSTFRLSAQTFCSQNYRNYTNRTPIAFSNSHVAFSISRA